MPQELTWVLRPRQARLHSYLRNSHAICNSKFARNKRRKQHVRIPAGNVRTRRSADLTPSIFRGTFCPAKHTVSRIHYLSKTHLVRDFLQKLQIEVEKRCSPRTRMLTRMLMVQMSKHMDLQSRRTLFCNSLVEQACTYFPCYQSAVWSVECRVWSVKCRVWSVKCGVWSVKCRVWSVGGKCRV